MILHLTTYLQGGAGRIIANLVLHQNARHRVVVATSRSSCDDHSNYPELLAKLDAQKVEVVFVDSLFTRNSAMLVQALSQLSASLDLKNVEFIHAHAAFPALLGILLRGLGARHAAVLQTMHGWGIRKNPEQSQMDVRILNCVDHVIAVSEASRKRLLDLGVESSKVSVIRCGVESVWDRAISDPKHEARIRRWKQEGRQIFCCIGSVGARKNQMLLLKALARIPHAKRAGLAVIGEGETAAFMAEAGRLGLGDSVYCTGYSPNACAYFALADWGILPSKDEGLPLSVLESFRAETPMIASDIPEIAELVREPETGLVFPNDDPEGCASAMQRALDTPELEREAMGKRAHQIWDKEFRQETMFDSYENIYGATCRISRATPSTLLA